MSNFQDILKFNVSNLPSSKAAYIIALKAIYKTKSKDEAIKIIAEKLHVKESTSRKMIDHMRIIGLLEKTDYGLRPSHLSQLYLDEDLTFERLFEELLKYDLNKESFVHFLRYSVLILFLIGKPITKKHLASVLSNLISGRSDESSIHTVYRNLSSVLPILENLGLVLTNKSVLSVDYYLSNNSSWRALNLPDFKSDFPSMNKVSLNSKDAIVIYESLNSYLDKSTSKEILNAISKTNGIFAWEPTSSSKQLDLYDYKGNKVRFFKPETQNG